LSLKASDKNYFKFKKIFHTDWGYVLLFDRDKFEGLFDRDKFEGYTN